MDSAAPAQLIAIQERIAAAHLRFGRPPERVELVAVSKTFDADAIEPLLRAGHRVFGENRVQEAHGKWLSLRASYPDVQLHLIGPLQTNKVRESVALFDVIETVDRDKLAGALATEMARTGRRIPCFIQVNIGREEQKAGIAPDETVDFVERCQTVHGLDIVGLMCIPPASEAPGPYFAQLKALGDAARLEQFSMGMSADFETAIAMGATHVRIGSALFGSRTPLGQ